MARKSDSLILHIFRNVLKCQTFSLLLLFLLASELLTPVDATRVAKGDYYTSVSGLEELLYTETILVKELQDHVTALTAHAEALQGEIEAIRSDHYAASKDLEGYLNNPLNAYRLIKRLYSDWTTFEESIRSESSGTKFLERLQTHRANLSFPLEDDLTGSAIAMVRLQETYQLDVAQLASGVLDGVKYGPAMSWQDCFLLGQQLYALRDYNHTVPWLKQSMNMLIEQDYNEDPMSLDFIETVAAYHHEMGDFETALELIDYVLSIEATREHARELHSFLQQKIDAGVRQGLLFDTTPMPGDYRKSNEFHLYEQVCRGEVTATPAQQRPLYCRYHTNNVPYRLLQPFKMEVLNFDPYIVQFHDVMSEAEINALKHLAKPKMRRSRVQSYDGNAEIPSVYRISKTAWLPYKKFPELRKMLVQLEHLSGLDMKYAEDLQVANYGMGGHYEPHWDFFTDEHTFEVSEGNRLATYICYLSDVEAGGGTAFPFVPLLVKPQKGSALFWYNLHSTDDLDYRTKHAACPVLKGSKWIANIWVRMRHQDRARPCELQPPKATLQYRDFD